MQGPAGEAVPAAPEPAQPAPQVGASLAHSARILIGRPSVTIALGAGVVLALLSLCCGIGVVMAPWLLCELNSMQLGEALGRPIAHNRTWIGACLIQLGAVVLTASVGWLSWLGFGTEATPIALTQSVELSTLVRPGGLLAIASALVSLVFVLPFVYAPLILIEARASLGGAVLESALLVARGGVLPHLALSLAANSVQVSPLIVAAAIAVISYDAELVPILAACSVPLLSVSVPLGQGMVVSAYGARREAVADSRRTRAAGHPTAPLLAVWALIVSAPVLSFGLLGASLVRPSCLPAGVLPERAEPIATFVPLKREQRVQPAGTALEIVASPRGVSVVASDGGGAGRLPLHGSEPIEAVRVARVRELYAIEVMQAGTKWLTWIDRSGVRQDDDLRARLLDHVPSWALWLMIGSLLATASALLPVLVSLAELRRLYAADPGTRPPPREMSERRARTLYRAFAIAALLAPLAVFSLYWGMRSAFG
jgi:hypothetical protein